MAASREEVFERVKEVLTEQLGIDENEVTEEDALFVLDVMNEIVQRIVPVEAGLALGLKPLQVFRYIILKPALRTVYPALASQFILLMLTSSVVSAISADDLTSKANLIQSLTFTTFEVYLVVTLMYLALSMAFSGLFSTIYRPAFSYPDRR